MFGAEELERVEGEKGFHVEVKIGDSVVVLEVGEPPATATRASVYVYVQDVDAAYERQAQPRWLSQQISPIRSEARASRTLSAIRGGWRPTPVQTELVSL